MCSYPLDATAELVDGVTAYRFDGPQDGPLLLLLHGATVPAWEFDRIVPFLIDAGFRCLRFDLYGHGRSAMLPRRHDQALFLNQTHALLKHLGIQAIHGVVGHSLGAPLAARLATAGRVSATRLILVAPLLDFISQQRALRWLTLPGLGELLLPTVIVPALIRRRTRRYRPLEDGRFVELFRQQAATKGYGQALLSLLRGSALTDQSSVYRSLAGMDARVLLLRGGDDNIVTAAQAERIVELIGAARHVELPATGHAVLMTDPEVATPHMLRFLADEG